MTMIMILIIDDNDNDNDNDELHIRIYCMPSVCLVESFFPSAVRVGKHYDDGVHFQSIQFNIPIHTHTHPLALFHFFILGWSVGAYSHVCSFQTSI